MAVSRSNMEHESTPQDTSDTVDGNEYRFCELGLPSMRAGYALTGYAVLSQARPDRPPYRQHGMKNVISRIAQLAVSNILTMALVGCFNMPTPPSQITGSYTAGLDYKDLSCQELAAEQASLARRENQLTTAQDQRIKASSVQAVLLGFGQGDGIEASELATVRGDKEAVRAALDVKGCRYETLKSIYRN